MSRVHVQRRASTALMCLSALLLGLLGATGSAAAAATAPRGLLVSAQQDTFMHRVTVHGWAYDPARSSSSVTVAVYVDKHYAGRGVADVASPGLDRGYHLTGRHDFTITVPWTPTARTVTIVSRGIHPTSRPTALSSRSATRYYPSAGARIVSVARLYVGKVRYVDGGASPAGGFDCSGYTQWVYSHARVHTLVHNAEAQRRAMRPVSVRYARPGDLVFYLSGGSAYHVAIYAGHGMQYAAATPRDGIRYQAVWSSAVQYRTDWH